MGSVGTFPNFCCILKMYLHYPPAQVVTHELSRPVHTPASGTDESIILETKEYVTQMGDRRDQLQGTLLRTGANPGDRLRRILGYKIEQRIVKAMSARKSRTNTRRPPKKRAKVRLEEKPKKSVRNTF